MSAFTNATPQLVAYGIQDSSLRAPVREPLAIPSHLPLVYLLTASGPADATMCIGDSFIQTYGAASLDPYSKFFNHQSVLANLMLGQGNAIMVQRIIPADAGPKARLLLSVAITDEQVPQYERNEDGSYKLNAQGAKIETGLPIAGHRLRWSLNNWASGAQNDFPFGEVDAKTGQDGATVYPVVELEANFQGDYGNNLGIRISAPTTSSQVPVNTQLSDRILSALFRISAIRRTDASSSPTLITNQQGDPALDFSFKPNAIDTSTGLELSLDQIFINAFQDLDTRGYPPVYGPFGRIKIYREELEIVLKKIATSEMTYAPAFGTDVDNLNIYLANPLTGRDALGAPYRSVVVDGLAQGGLLFGESANLFASGGSDGTVSLAAYDEAVKTEASNFGYGVSQLLDDASYPFSHIYDTGFTLPTKMALLTPLGRRKDVGVVLSTQDVSRPKNNAAEESSIAASLKVAARNYPESEMYGTPVCRAVVIGGAGHLIDSKYPGILPLTLELGVKSAKYMGSGDGIWRNGFGFDMPPLNQITLFRDVNVVFKPANQRVRDWDVGLVWVQKYDMQSLFWPALQTVYDDDTSILNSYFTMCVAIELQKVAQRTWRDLTGISTLTADQFIQKSDELINERTVGRFDDRVVVRPETYYTKADEQRGYSWACKIHMYGNNMKTVGTFTIQAHRMSDLPEASPGGAV